MIYDIILVYLLEFLETNYMSAMVALFFILINDVKLLK